MASSLATAAAGAGYVAAGAPPAQLGAAASASSSRLASTDGCNASKMSGAGAGPAAAYGLGRATPAAPLRTNPAAATESPPHECTQPPKRSSCSGKRAARIRAAQHRWECVPQASSAWARECGLAAGARVASRVPRLGRVGRAMGATRLEGGVSGTRSEIASFAKRRSRCAPECLLSCKSHLGKSPAGGRRRFPRYSKLSRRAQNRQRAAQQRARAASTVGAPRPTCCC